MKAHRKTVLALLSGFVVISAVFFAGGRFLLVRKMTEAQLPLFALLFGFLGLLVVAPVFFWFFGNRKDPVEKLAELTKNLSPEQCETKINWEENDSCKPIADLIDGLSEMTRDLKKAEEELGNRLLAFESLCPDTLVFLHDNGEIVECRVRVREEIMASVESVIKPGNNILTSDFLIPHGGKIRLAEIDEISEKGKCLVAEVSLRDASGGIMWFEARICRIGPDLLLAAFRDNTVLHTAGLEHAAIQQKINQMQRTENFGLIAGGLAHDYNNMLTAMQGNVELLLCEDISPEVRETVEDIKTAMHRSSELVHRMLAHVRKSEPIEEKIDLNSLISNLIRLVSRSIPNNADVDFVPGGKIPLIAADSVQVWQVVMNLVVNACDALNGRRGFVHVRTSVRKFGDEDFAPYQNGAALKPGLFAVLEVEDSGLGMDESTSKRIFSPFFTTKPTGKGLGLASVAAIVAASKGGISVESELGVGTTFRIIVPVCLREDGSPLFKLEEAPVEKKKNIVPSGKAVAMAEAARKKEENERKAAAAPAASVTSSSDGKKSILVVDDDTSILKLLKIILTSGGYKVTIASSGEEGLKTYDAAEGKFDVCLVDASMGTGMNGLDLCSAIRSRNTEIPLVLMSAYRAKEMSAKMASSGVSGFLAKPFRSADVLETIKRYQLTKPVAKGETDGAV